MSKRHCLTAEQKVAVIRRHLLENVTVSDLCDELGIHATQYYNWQKQLFESGASALERRTNAANKLRKEDANVKKIAELQAKLKKKNEVVATGKSTSTMPRCRAIAAEKREAVSMLYQEGMTKREIARLLRTTPHTVRRIIKQKGMMPRSVRSDKIQIAPELLRELHKQCNGQALLVHEKLTEKHGIQVGYSTLTRSLRGLGLRGGQSTDGKKGPTTRGGSRRSFVESPSFETIEADLDNSDDLAELLHYARNGRPRQRKKAIVVLARKRGIINSHYSKRPRIFTKHDTTIP